MINSMQRALVKKDIRAVTMNKRLFSVLLIVPLVMTIFIPSIFMMVAILTPLDSADIQIFMGTLGMAEEISEAEVREALTKVMMNDALPAIFLMIPIMAASVMAASSFVGEKEKRTLETLLYCPMSLRQIFDAKIFASFVLSQFVTLLSFIAMLLVVQTEVWIMTRQLVPLGVSWLIILFIMSPAMSLIAITLIVKGSAKAKSVEESQQRSAFLVVPVILLLIMQFSGVQIFSIWLLLGISVICLLIGVILLNRSPRKFNYEGLLR